MPPIILITRSTASNRYKYYMCVYFTLMQVQSVIDRKNDTRLRVDVLDWCLNIPLTGFAFDIHKNQHFLEFKRFSFTIYLINMMLKFILLKKHVMKIKKYYFHLSKITLLVIIYQQLFTVDCWLIN